MAAFPTTSGNLWSPIQHTGMNYPLGSSRFWWIPRASGCPQISTSPLRALRIKGFRLLGYICLFAVALVLFLIFIIGRKAWGRFQDPSDLPLVQRIRRWGDLYHVSAEIEREFNGAMRLKQGSVRLTDKYVISSSCFDFEVYRTEDLLWAYKSTTIVHLVKLHTAVLFFHEGMLSIMARERKVDSILQYLADKTPWAIFGHSNEIRKTFGKNRSGFCHAVEERRRQLSR